VPGIFPAAMEKKNFDDAVKEIVKRKKRFTPAGFYFLKDALDFTVQRVVNEHGDPRHVSGPELLEGFRDYALEQFGPMASTLLNEWDIRSCSDVGEMVFQLIEEGIFGKQESDTKEDFDDIYDFEETFVKPFLPGGGKA
jgi:uncharacterized repeat protein (TIGR04138 family)